MAIIIWGKIPTKKRSSIMSANNTSTNSRWTNPPPPRPPTAYDDDYWDEEKEVQLAAFRLWTMRYDVWDEDEFITPGESKKEEAAKMNKKKRKLTADDDDDIIDGETTDLLWLPQPLKKRYFKNSKNRGYKGLSLADDNNTSRRCKNSGNGERDLPPYPPIEKLNGCIGDSTKPFSKKITRTDVTDSHCRLMIRKEQVEEYVMPLILRGGERLTKDGIDVMTYDSHGKQWPMKLKQWADGKFVVLSGVNWKKFYQDQGMSPYDEGMECLIDIWAFRHLQTGQISFAIIPTFTERASTSSSSISGRPAIAN